MELDFAHRPDAVGLIRDTIGSFVCQLTPYCNVFILEVGHMAGEPLRYGVTYSVSVYSSEGLLEELSISATAELESHLTMYHLFMVFIDSANVSKVTVEGHKSDHLVPFPVPAACLSEVVKLNQGHGRKILFLQKFCLSEEQYEILKRSSVDMQHQRCAYVTQDDEMVTIKDTQQETVGLVEQESCGDCRRAGARARASPDATPRRADSLRRPANGSHARHADGSR